MKIIHISYVFMYIYTIYIDMIYIYMCSIHGTIPLEGFTNPNQQFIRPTAL